MSRSPLASQPGSVLTTSFRPARSISPWSRKRTPPPKSASTSLDQGLGGGAALGVGQHPLAHAG